MLAPGDIAGDVDAAARDATALPAGARVADASDAAQSSTRKMFFGEALQPSGQNTKAEPRSRLIFARRKGNETRRGNPMPIHEIAERWIDKYERGCLCALAKLKTKLEGESDG